MTSTTVETLQPQRRRLSVVRLALSIRPTAATDFVSECGYFGLAVRFGRVWMPWTHLKSAALLCP